MSLLLAPVLAQLVTLGVSDRTEARLIASEQDQYLEASTAPGVGLNFAWRRVGLTLGYSPYFIVTPLDRDSRELIVLHNAGTQLQYTRQWGRTTLTVGQSVTFGQHDYRLELIAPLPELPVPDTGVPGGEPGAGDPGGGSTGGGSTGGTGSNPTPAPSAGAGAPSGGAAAGPANPAQDARNAQAGQVRYATSTTSIGLTHGVSRTSTVSGDLAYSVSGGTDEESRRTYPIIHGPRASLRGTQRIGRSDTVSEYATSQYAYINDDEWSWVSGFGVDWSHSFGKYTTLTLGAGLAITWTALEDGTEILRIFPTFGSGAGTGIAHRMRLGGGILVLNANASIAPVIDPATVDVDPRLGVGGGLTWTKKRLTVAADVASAISLNDEIESALNGISAQTVVSYDLGAGFAADGGIRAAWQTFAGRTVLPPTWSAFVGLSWAAALPLN